MIGHGFFGQESSTLWLLSKMRRLVSWCLQTRVQNPDLIVFHGSVVSKNFHLGRELKRVKIIYLPQKLGMFLFHHKSKHTDSIVFFLYSNDEYTG